jgi:hypothetical protein
MATQGRRSGGRAARLPFTTDHDEEITMPEVMVFHEVDDVDHWLRSTKRDEFFGPLGITVRTFVNPNRVGLVGTVPDMDTLRTALASEAAADAMKFDGVRPETMVMLVES